MYSCYYFYNATTATSTAATNGEKGKHTFLTLGPVFGQMEGESEWILFQLLLTFRLQSG